MLQETLEHQIALPAELYSLQPTHRLVPLQRALALERIARLANQYCDKTACKNHPILREMEQLCRDLERMECP
jgi:hypothetical protein